jgi:hypothetical protein
MCRGFWLDLTVSPFVAMGLECETPNSQAEGLFTIQSKNSGTEQWRHNTVEIAVYNCLAWMHEIETGQQYLMRQEHKVYSGLGDKLAASDASRMIPETLMEALAVDENEDGDDGGDKNKEEGEGKKGKDAPATAAAEPSEKDDSIFDLAAQAAPASPKAKAKAAKLKQDEEQARQDHADALRRAQTIVQSLAGVKIRVLTGNLFDLCRKKSYQGKFDKVVLSTQSCHLLKEANMAALLAPGAEVCVESPKFVHPLTTDQMTAYTTKVLVVVHAENPPMPAPIPTPMACCCSNDS